MTVTIPLVFIAGVIVWLAYRYMGLRVGNLPPASPPW